MTVSTFEPKAITATEAARRHLRAQIAESGLRACASASRRAAATASCTPWTSRRAPAGTTAPHDLGDGVSIYVRDEDLPLVQGTEIDWSPRA
jgi:Fe-S cluster assembly iron-binding protein IscA